MPNAIVYETYSPCSLRAVKVAVELLGGGSCHGGSQFSGRSAPLLLTAGTRLLYRFGPDIAAEGLHSVSPGVGLCCVSVRCWWSDLLRRSPVSRGGIGVVVGGGTCRLCCSCGGFGWCGPGCGVGSVRWWGLLVEGGLGGAELG